MLTSVDNLQHNSVFLLNFPTIILTCCPFNLHLFACVSCRVAVLISSGSNMASPTRTTVLPLAHTTPPRLLLPPLLLLSQPKSDLWSPTLCPVRSLRRGAPAPRRPPAHPLPCSITLRVHPQPAHPLGPEHPLRLDPHPGSDDETRASDKQLIHPITPYMKKEKEKKKEHPLLSTQDWDSRGVKC